jgi:hypothetical protein
MRGATVLWAALPVHRVGHGPAGGPGPEPEPSLSGTEPVETTPSKRGTVRMVGMGSDRYSQSPYEWFLRRGCANGDVI